MVINGVTSDGSKVTTCTVCHTAVTCAASARYQQLRGAKSAFPPLNAGAHSLSERRAVIVSLRIALVALKGV